jgi:hypothetical protein
MTSRTSPTIEQTGGSPLSALRRFTELVLAELNRSSEKRKALAAQFGVLCSSEETCNPELTPRQPFGLVFQEGQRAAFNLPAGRRFVVEYLRITSWRSNPHLLIQLTTESQSMFRNLTLCSAFDELSIYDGFAVTAASPVQIWEQTTNTLLFTYGDRRYSAMVPTETCVQMWGYLEASSFRPVPRSTRDTQR